MQISGRCWRGTRHERMVAIALIYDRSCHSSSAALSISICFLCLLLFVSAFEEQLLCDTMDSMNGITCNPRSGTCGGWRKFGFHWRERESVTRTTLMRMTRSNRWWRSFSRMIGCLWSAACDLIECSTSTASDSSQCSASNSSLLLPVGTWYVSALREAAPCRLWNQLP